MPIAQTIYAPGESVMAKLSKKELARIRNNAEHKIAKYAVLAVTIPQGEFRELVLDFVDGYRAQLARLANE